jgi:hypothetical protein
MATPAWNQSEIDNCIGLYLLMRVLVERDVPFVKAQLLREIIGAPTPANPEGNPDATLHGRSKGSVEMKLMNITAALESIGRDDLSMAEHGYRPMKNMQAALKVRVAELVEGNSLNDLDEKAEQAA